MDGALFPALITRPERKRRSRRTLAGVTAAVVVAALGVTAVFFHPPVAHAACGPEAGSLDDATKLAKACGKRVEATGARTEVSQTFVDPSGSRTSLVSATPQRVKRSDGSWVAVDPRLKRLPDGSPAPVASTARVAFSAGGTAPLVRFAAGTGRLDYTWPTALPVPSLDGDTAVYAEALPGVDLRVRALVDGFTYSLVVKSRTAATNPALRSVRLSLSASGGISVRPRPSGGFDAVDRSGTPAISAGQGLMWDATGTAVDAATLARGPADRSTTHELAAKATATSLTVIPDPTMLSSATTTFPLVIDPVSKTVPKSKFGYTDSTNATRDDGIARVGQNPDGSGTFRSFFSFATGTVIGGPATVMKAQFQTYLTHSWSCSNTPVNLYAVGDFSVGKNAWSGPAISTWIGEQQGHAHKPSQGGESCGTDPQPDAYMEWTDGALKTGVQAALDAGWTSYALGLLNRQSNGANETTTTWWKKFDPARTYLYIEWNKTPTTPVAADMETAAASTVAGVPCTTSPTPQIRSDQPILRAKLRDPDNEAGGALRGEFQTQQYAAATDTWVDPPLGSGSRGVSYSQASLLTDYVPPATPSSPSNTAAVHLNNLVQGATYRWRVQTGDVYGALSSWSSWCQFVVSSQPLSSVPKISSTDGMYPTPDATHTGTYGAVGQPGQFTFTANGTPVSKYEYHLEGGDVRTITALDANGAPAIGGSATVWIAPDHVLDNVLYVVALDAAANRSDAAEYLFEAGTSASELSTWKFLDGAGRTASATGLAPQSATLSTNGVSWGTGHIIGGSAATGGDGSIDITTGYAETAAKLLDTTRAFSVSAWVRLGSLPTGPATIVSQDGVTGSSFMLRYLVPTFTSGQRPMQSGGGWCFSYVQSDGGSATLDMCSWTVPRAGEWTHLVGVYDPTAQYQNLKLYVNGALIDCNPPLLGGHRCTGSPTVWAANGKFAIGRAKTTGAASQPFPGRIGEVHTWQRMVYQAEINAVLAPVVVGAWDFQSAADTGVGSGADVSGYGRTLTPIGTNADFGVNTLNMTSAAHMAGTGEFDSVGAVLATNTSFTVATWVSVESPTSVGMQTFVAEDGPTQGSFSLSYRGDNGGEWVAQLVTTNGLTTYSAVSPASNAADWHHVAAVYRAGWSLTLYVDGVYQNAVSVSLPVGSDTAGPLVLGRSRINGLTAQWFTGMVDKLRIYWGTLPDADVARLASDSN